MTSFSTHQFEFEREMGEPVLDWLQGKGLKVKTEFATPWGICDMVGAKLRASGVRLRLSYGQRRAVGPILRLQVLSRVPDKKSGSAITFEELHADSFECLSSERLRAELEHLEQGKFIASPSPDVYYKLNGWAPLHRKIIAVELKLSKISEALLQAHSNLAFATESYIALPMHRALRVARSPLGKTIEKSGVGLLGVSSAECRRLFAGARAVEVCDDVLQAHCVERFWRTRDSSP